MGTLRHAGARIKKRKRQERRDLKGLVDKNEMLRIGAPPVIRRNTSLEDTWEVLLKDPPIAHSDPNRWRQGADVRPSSFPFCGRKYVMDRLGLKMADDFTVSANFYTEIGKAVHYVAQNAFAQTGRLWGFWICARPSCEDRVARRPYSPTPGFHPRKNKRCPTCGSKYFEYEELTIKDARIGLRGHCDGILIFDKFSSVLEVKTAGPEKVAKLLDMSNEDLSTMVQTENPWYGYWHQASTYAALLRIKYPSIPVIKRVDFLIYARDKPTNVVAFSLDVPQDNSWWLEIRSRILQAKHALKLELIPEGFATSKAEIDALPTCKWCSHKEVCLNPKGKVDFAADALYDTSVKQDLQGVLDKEREKWAQSSLVTL